MVVVVVVVVMMMMMMMVMMMMTEQLSHETRSRRRVYCSVQYLDVVQVVNGSGMHGHGCHNGYVATLRQKN